MKPHRIVAVLAVVIFASMVSIAEAQQAQTQSQSAQQSEAKPDAKPDATLAGKWNVGIESPNGSMEAGLDLKIDGKKVAGVISTQQFGESKIEGEFAEGKLTFWFTLDANGQQINVTFTGTQKKDGTLAGTLNYGQGEVPWTATRAK